MKRRRVLLIAYHFPPLGGIASLRALRFARLLPELGWDVTVLTSARGDYHQDASLVPDEARVVRTGALELSRMARTLAAGRPPASADAPGPQREAERGARRAALSRLARRWLYWPDAQIGWYPFALAAARRLVRERRFDAIFSSAYPMTSHRVARRLARDTRLPWVADFRDLWTDWSRDSGLRLRLDQRLERSVLREARAVTSVSPTYAALFAERGARRTATLVNSFDAPPHPRPAAVLDPVPREREALVVHLGTYYPGFHDLAPAVRALGALRRDGTPLRLVFVGSLPDALRPALVHAELSDQAEATGLVPHQQALARVAGADLLLLGAPPDASAPAARGWIPAKVFEYLGARRRLLVAGDAQSDVARLAAGFARVRVAPAGDERAIATAVAELLAARVPAEDDASLEPYTSRAVAARLATLLDSLE